MTDDATASDAASGGTESDVESNSTATDAASNGTETTDEPETVSLPRCPRCGTPIAQRTMIGPGEAVAGPCGCRVAPPDPNRSDSNSDAE
ncbi:hypothetical protein [Natrialba asiatica]|uniref:Small CPxCG-related zinc finger protein n=1 Tax=Natrialba asiatica (strain ATCC 700177 / DSM 12278 / JCM 9576 / FERM P-10747 / NBRC 102637 / 172P1) TaxID=29540 RepID=M0AXD0_NATA1|nr:hypothetical protein [Natrialba asiatica]ELZ02628.1 hypothetical protein C481_08171 [Natrialba asiatica DSM 12278]